MRIKNYFLAGVALIAAGTINAQEYVSPAENVAVGKAAVASTGTASMAFDDNTDTRWESSQIDGQWIYVDLGKDYAIDQLQLVWEGAYAKQYKIFVASELTEEMTAELSDDDLSNDFQTGWTEAASVNEELSGFPYTQNVDVKAGTYGRYVALQTVERGTNYGTSLWEFRVKSFGEYVADGAETASKMFVSANPTEIYTGETATLSPAVINGKNLRIENAEVAYSVSPADGLSIESNIATGVASGNYTVTATSGSVSANCTITVREEPVLASIEITADKTQGSTNDTYTFTVNGKNQFGEPFTVENKEYSADGAGNATFDGDKMTVDARGQYIVTLKSGDVTSNAVTINVVAEGANLALGKTIVSSTEGSENPQNAVDGNEGTMWITNQPSDAVAGDGTTFIYDAEIVVDLGEEYDVNCVHTYWEGASSADYTVTFSTDNSVWSEPTEAFTFTDGAGMQNRHDWLMQEEAVKARYVKVHSTRAATGYGVKIRELEVYSNSPLAPAELRHIEIAADATAGHVDSNYNFTVAMTDQYGKAYTLTPEEQAEWVVSGGAMTGNAFKADAKGAYTVKYKVGEIESNEVTINIVAEGENILAGKTIVSTSEGDNYQIDRPAANVIDGNDGSDWFIKDVNNSTTFTAEFVADFGDVANVDAVHLHFEGANSCDYKILFSTDNVEFTPWKSYSAEPKVENRHDWLYAETTTPVRYIKFVSNEVSNGGYGLRLFEVEAYGEDNGHLAGGIEDINVNGNIYLAGDVVVMPVVMSKAMVFSASGAMVATADNADQINVSGLQSGMYIVKAVDAEGNAYTAKIAK